MNVILSDHWLLVEFLFSCFHAPPKIRIACWSSGPLILAGSTAKSDGQNKFMPHQPRCQSHLEHQELASSKSITELSRSVSPTVQSETRDDLCAFLLIWRWNFQDLLDFGACEVHVCFWSKRTPFHPGPRIVFCADCTRHGLLTEAAIDVNEKLVSRSTSFRNMFASIYSIFLGFLSAILFMSMPISRFPSTSQESPVSRVRIHRLPSCKVLDKADFRDSWSKLPRPQIQQRRVSSSNDFQETASLLGSARIMLDIFDVPSRLHVRTCKSLFQNSSMYSTRSGLFQPFNLTTEFSLDERVGRPFIARWWR